jgi:hypothetical protein
MCGDCLDEWDAAGESWQSQRVHVVVVVGGDSKCVKHYRAWRDRNKPVVPALEAPKG